MFFEQVADYRLMGCTSDYANVVIIGEPEDFIIVGNIGGWLQRITKAGEAVGCDTGDIVF